MNTPISLGIMAFNEEKNISLLLTELQEQKLKEFSIKEVIVISSGSTDKTDFIIKTHSKVDKRIRPIFQKKRKGKAAAVNLFISKARSKIIVLMSADILLKKNTLENLLRPLNNPKIGIVGCHPIPVNDPTTFFGFAAHLLWKLHHEISKSHPKMGEMIAFRKIFTKIPVLSAVDEANIEPLIRGQDYHAAYAPQAIVYNKGPENLKEFIARRRHIYFGHITAKHEYSYEVSTFSGFNIFFLILKNLEFNWRFFLWTPFVILLEIYSRFLGSLDYKFKLKNHTIWDVTHSTKKIK
jgi:glycosyltransferase involved in cell wall biosynthesis